MVGFEANHISWKIVDNDTVMKFKEYYEWRSACLKFLSPCDYLESLAVLWRAYNSRWTLSSVKE